MQAPCPVLQNAFIICRNLQLTATSTRAACNQRALYTAVVVVFVVCCLRHTPREMHVLSNLRRGSWTPIAVTLFLLSAQRSFCALTDTERSFIEVPSPDSARESLQYITSKPHVAGTPGDYEVREGVAAATSFRPRIVGRLLWIAGRLLWWQLVFVLFIMKKV